MRLGFSQLRAARVHWLGALGLLAALTVGVVADPPATRPAAPSHPLLQQLNAETESLYRDISASLVRVQLPQPKWMNDYAMAPINRWEKLDPQVRRRLMQQMANSQNIDGANNFAPQNAAPPPATEPSPAQYNNTILVPSQQMNDAGQSTKPQQQQDRQAVLGGKLPMNVNVPPTLSPNQVGIVLDDAGHVLAPLYVERESIGSAPVRAILADGTVADGKFIGSDRQTNLTLLQFPARAGRAVQLSARRPVEGSLLLSISTADASGRLGVWTAAQQDPGVLFTTDGGMAGIARYGQFLSARACHLIAEEIITYGSVRRATLGVIITEISRDDVLREQQPLLGSRTAMRIDEVVPGSTADRAGLKKGDVLLALAGESCSDIPSLAAAIAAREGATELQILRENQVIRITVDLRPQQK